MSVKRWDERKYTLDKALSADDILKLLSDIRDDELADIICELIVRRSKLLEAVREFTKAG